MIRIVFAAMIAFMLGFAPALAEEEARKPEGPMPVWRIIPEKSFVKFVALQNSAPVEGKFPKISGTFTFDEERLDQSVITAEVDLADIVTQDSQVAAELVKPAWLDAKNFPKAKLRSIQIYKQPKRIGSQKSFFYADSNLSIKGITRPAAVNFIIDQMDEERAAASGRISLLRRDYNVGTGEWEKVDVVEDVVTINFRVIAERVK